jgi:nucleoid DNA-binding protein
MTWDEFVRKYAAETRQPIVHARRRLELLQELLVIVARDAGGLCWPGLGTWYRKAHKSRRIHNPATGEPMRLPAQVTLGFKASKTIRDGFGKPRLANADRAPCDDRRQVPPRVTPADFARLKRFAAESAKGLKEVRALRKELGL